MKTPSLLGVPVYLMNFPFTVDNREPNNVYMEEKIGEHYDWSKASQQFLRLYHTLAEKSLVYLLPSYPGDFQDLPFVANLGAIIGDDVFLASNFKTEPRRGEEFLGERFFSALGYEIFQPPYFWEGEADLKYISNNRYVGGWGMRSSAESYAWMAEQFGIEITKVQLKDEKLFHLDCSFFPLSEKKALVVTSVFSPEDLHKLENAIEIIEVPKENAYDGWTNVVRVGHEVFHSPRTLESGRALGTILQRAGYDLKIVVLSEFEKSGADLSCLIMHLNHKY